MSDLHAHVLQTATVIQDALDVHTFGTCTQPAVIVTAGQPAASIAACSQIAVWLEQVQDAGGQQTFGQTSGPDCVTRRVAVIGIQVGICYTDPAENADIPAATRRRKRSVWRIWWMSCSAVWPRRRRMARSGSVRV